ncbi:hypothetical protein CR513_46609, partial [Mucuna pruriens]
MVNTQIGDMVRTLCNMYLKDTNHNLHSDNNNLCSLYSRVPWRIWSSKWPRITFNSKRICFTSSKHIPSQTILSPQANMSVITLRSGMKLLQQQI